MEVLVVTLAYTTPVKDVDTLVRIRLIQDTVRNTQGLVTSRFYRGRGSSPCYAILTTWESDEAWKQAQERYNPKQLLASSAAELLVSPPEQLLFTYIWGYIRPAVAPELAAIHLATVRPEQADVAQRGWVEGLKRQAMQSSLAFGFLARGRAEQSAATEPLRVYTQGATFLNLLSWSRDGDREDFYADVHFTAVHRFISSIGTMQIITLEPL
ncbi:MAG: hypothetical protein PVS3B3_00800 [Ktedonobacteraceae bacterium]